MRKISILFEEKEHYRILSLGTAAVLFPTGLFAQYARGQNILLMCGALLGAAAGAGGYLHQLVLSKILAFWLLVLLSFYTTMLFYRRPRHFPPGVQGIKRLDLAHI